MRKLPKIESSSIGDRLSICLFSGLVVQYALKASCQIQFFSYYCHFLDLKQISSPHLLVGQTEILIWPRVGRKILRNRLN